MMRAGRWNSPEDPRGAASGLHSSWSPRCRVGNSLVCFFTDSLVVCERKSNSLVKKSESLLSLFCHERPERIAHGRSFVKIDGSESLKSLVKTLIYKDVCNVHIWYSNFKWLFLFKFLCTKILKQLVLPFQSIVFIHMFLNLWHNYAFISFKVHFLNSEIEYHICTQGAA